MKQVQTSNSTAKRNSINSVVLGLVNEPCKSTKGPENCFPKFPDRCFWRYVQGRNFNNSSVNLAIQVQYDVSIYRRDSYLFYPSVRLCSSKNDQTSFSFELSLVKYHNVLFSEKILNVCVNEVLKLCLLSCRFTKRFNVIQGPTLSSCISQISNSC